MNTPRPHFFLYSESDNGNYCNESAVGQWRFRLESADRQEIELEAGDDEPEVGGPRLELLAVVRGLEALDQPSRVTLVTSSRYVSRGLKFGLDSWRQRNWQWERYGRMTAVEDQDLWQRVDRALQYHRVECRTWRFDAAHGKGPAPKRHVLRFAASAAKSESQDAADDNRKPPARRRWVDGALRAVNHWVRVFSAFRPLRIPGQGTQSRAQTETINGDREECGQN